MMSKTHHAAGAATQEEADQQLAALVDRARVEWDGEGVPALVMME